MVAPRQPQLAARLAEQAGMVSHDGEAVHAAMLWAAMEAEAFGSSDIDHLLDTGLAQIPRDSLIARLIADVRAWHKANPDWRETRKQIEAKYGYDKFPGNCHVVPNHALMVMAVLYAPDDFQKAQMIVNTSGWDTDCNAGNVGCLLGIMNGLDGLDAGSGLARADRRPDADLVRRRRQLHQRRGAPSLLPDQSGSATGRRRKARGAERRRAVSLLACRAASRASGRRRATAQQGGQRRQCRVRDQPGAGDRLRGARARAGRGGHDADLLAARDAQHAHLRSDGDAAGLSRARP